MTKKLLTSFLILITLSAGAQKVQKKDSTTLTDTTVFLSVRAMDNAVNSLKDRISVKQYEDYQAIVRLVFDIVAKEWEAKRKK